MSGSNFVECEGIFATIIQSFSDGKWKCDEYEVIRVVQYYAWMYTTFMPVLFQVGLGALVVCFVMMKIWKVHHKCYFNILTVYVVFGSCLLFATNVGEKKRAIEWNLRGIFLCVNLTQLVGMMVSRILLVDDEFDGFDGCSFGGRGVLVGGLWLVGLILTDIIVGGWEFVVLFGVRIVFALLVTLLLCGGYLWLSQALLVKIGLMNGSGKFVRVFGDVKRIIFYAVGLFLVDFIGTNFLTIRIVPFGVCVIYAWSFIWLLCCLEGMKSSMVEHVLMGVIGISTIFVGHESTMVDIFLGIHLGLIWLMGVGIVYWGFTRFIKQKMG